MSGRGGRDAGIDAALSAERAVWLAKAIQIIEQNFRKPWEGLAEEFQEPVRDRIGPPHVPQVWSALTMVLIRKFELFEHTGSHRQCRKTTNHACDGKVLRRL